MMRGEGPSRCHLQCFPQKYYSFEDQCDHSFNVAPLNCKRSEFTALNGRDKRMLNFG